MAFTLLFISSWLFCCCSAQDQLILGPPPNMDAGAQQPNFGAGPQQPDFGANSQQSNFGAGPQQPNFGANPQQPNFGPVDATLQGPSPADPQQLSGTFGVLQQTQQQPQQEPYQGLPMAGFQQPQMMPYQQPTPYNNGFGGGSQQTQEQPQCNAGDEQKRRSFIYVCRNGNWEPGFCVLPLPQGGEQRITMNDRYDVGDFVFECSQPSLGRVSLKVVACSIDGQRFDVGQSLTKGRWVFKCLDKPVRKEIIGCVGDDGQAVYNMGVVILAGKPHRCIAGNGIYETKKL